MTRKLPSDDYIGIAAIVCEHVFDTSSDILLVSHDREGDWQFLCGKEGCHDHTKAKVVGLNYLLDDDQSLHDVMNLPEGHLCERKKKGEIWIIEPLSEKH